MDCPPECREDREQSRERIERLESLAIPGWARATIIAAIWASFSLAGAAYVYGNQQYADKSELQEVMRSIRSLQADVKELLKRR